MAYVVNNRVFRTLSEAQEYITESDFAVTPTITETTVPVSTTSSGMLTGGPISDTKETKTLPGESGPFDPNAGTIVSFGDIGNYHVAINFKKLIDLVTGSISVTLFPAFSSLSIILNQKKLEMLSTVL